jgi:ribosomal protein S17E
VTTLNADARQIAHAVIEALDLPYAAAASGGQVRQAIVKRRAMHLLIALQNLVDDKTPSDVEWELEYLRRKLAEHPAAGYVTQAQAHERLAAGADWMQAVSLDYGKETDR